MLLPRPLKLQYLAEGWSPESLPLHLLKIRLTSPFHSPSSHISRMAISSPPAVLTERTGLFCGFRFFPPAFSCACESSFTNCSREISCICPSTNPEAGEGKQPFPGVQGRLSSAGRAFLLPYGLEGLPLCSCALFPHPYEAVSQPCVCRRFTHSGSFPSGQCGPAVSHFTSSMVNCPCQLLQLRQCFPYIPAHAQAGTRRTP